MPMYRVRTVFTGVAGSPYYSNLYFTEEGGTAAQARTAVASFWFALIPSIREDLLWTVEQDVAVVDEVSGDIIRVDAGGAPILADGNSTEDPLPPMVQALLRTRTGAFSGGREIRGRVFIPGLTEPDSDGGVPVVPLRASIDGAAATLIAAATAQWVVWAKTRGEYAVVNSANTWNQWSVLRSRRD